MCGAEQGDTASLPRSLLQASRNLQASLLDESVSKAEEPPPLLSEVVTDKGYHSNQSAKLLKVVQIRSYLSEPDRGRRQPKKDPEAQAAVYGNRRRIRGARGQALQRLGAEYTERSFAHLYRTGGMSRTHLRGQENISKRLCIHGRALNLGLVMRKITGAGTPRGLWGLLSSFFACTKVLKSFLDFLMQGVGTFGSFSCRWRFEVGVVLSDNLHDTCCATTGFSTDC